MTARPLALSCRIAYRRQVSRHARAASPFPIASALCAWLGAMILFLMPSQGLTATVMGNIQDSTGAGYSGGALRTLQFIPLSCPQNVVLNGATNTIWPINVSVKVTNGVFTANLVGGLYWAGFVDATSLLPKTVKLLVPPNDTNTYTLADCMQFATNASVFTWNGYFTTATNLTGAATNQIIELIHTYASTNGGGLASVTTSNSATVTFSGNGTPTNPLTATAIGGGTVNGITNNQTGVTLSGTFSGNGQGLTVNTNTVQSIVGGMGVVTNDLAANAFIAARLTMTARSQELLNGAVSEMYSAGYRANLVDFWPLVSSQGATFGTNQTSFNGRAWSGWNQAITGKFTNLQQTLPAPCIARLPLETNLSGGWTLAITLSTPQILYGGGGAGVPTDYGCPYFILRNTNNSDFITLTETLPQVDKIQYGQGTNFVYGPSDQQYRSNNVLYQTTGGFVCNQQLESYRRTIIISFDGTNTFRAWRDGVPAAFTVSNSVNYAALKYTTPFNLTNVWNEITLGYDSRWGTNDVSWLSGTYGTIYNLMLFNLAAGTNSIASDGTVTVPALITLANKACRWLEPSEKMVAFDGTSMFSPDYSVSSVLTNTIWQGYLSISPEVVDIQPCSRAGSQMITMTNFGIGYNTSYPPTARLVDVQNYRYSHNNFYSLPWWVKGEMIVDHPRNDATKTTIAEQNRLFNSFYGPLKTNGFSVTYISTSIPVDVGSNAVLTTSEMMVTNASITRYIGNHKIIAPKGIVDAYNTALSTGAHFDGSDQSLAWYIVQAQARTLRGLPFVLPYAGQFATITEQYPTYSVTLSGTPAHWTNIWCDKVSFNYSGGTVSAIAKNGKSISANVTGGSVILNRNEWVTFTNSIVPNASFSTMP